MELGKYIETNPAVMLGKPVIKGTRITVEILNKKLGEGASDEDIMEMYPHIKKVEIQAAKEYARAYLEIKKWVMIDREMVSGTPCISRFKSSD